MKRKYNDYEKEIYFRGRDRWTPPQHAICPPMQYFEPMEAVSFVYFNKEMVLFFRFRVIY